MHHRLLWLFTCIASVAVALAVFETNGLNSLDRWRSIITAGPRADREAGPANTSSLARGGQGPRADREAGPANTSSPARGGQGPRADQVAGPANTSSLARGDQGRWHRRGASWEWRIRAPTKASTKGARVNFFDCLSGHGKPIWIVFAGDSNMRNMLAWLTNKDAVSTRKYQQLQFPARKWGSQWGDEDFVFLPKEPNLFPIRLSLRFAGFHVDYRPDKPGKGPVSNGTVMDWRPMHNGDGQLNSYEWFDSEGRYDLWGSQPSALLFSLGLWETPAGERPDCKNAFLAAESLSRRHGVGDKIYWVTVGTRSGTSKPPSVQQSRWGAECELEAAAAHGIPVLDMFSMSAAALDAKGPGKGLALQSDGYHWRELLYNEVVSHWLDSWCI